MDNNLQIAVQNLYTVFKPYTIIGNIRNRSCDCCVTDYEIKILLSKPLKELEANDLQTFITSALTTFGDIVDYKYFLPRILELIQYSETDVLDDFVTFEKLNYSKWKTWNDDEINAITNYLRFYGKLYFLFKEVGFV